MADSAPPAFPSAETLAFTGRVWTKALARQAEGLLWMGVGYPLHLIESFQLVPWDELGSDLQENIARELGAFLELCRKAGRG